MVGILAGIFTILMVYFIVRQTRKPSGFPPGPPKLPIIGSLPFLMAKAGPDEPYTLRAGLKQLVKQYGDTIGFFVGQDKVILLTDYQKIKEFLKMEETADRPSLKPMNEFREGYKTLDGTPSEGSLPGVAFCNGAYWREQRRFLLRNLRDFGFGKKGMQDLVMVEVERLCKKLKDLDRRPTTLNRLMNISIVNALMIILFGETIKMDDPDVMDVISSLEALLRNNSGPRPPIASFVPHRSMLKWPILRDISGMSRFKVAFANVNKALKKFVDHHKDTLDPENIRDFLDLLLVEVKNTTDPTSSFFKDRGMAFVKNDLLELFVGGSETTASMLQWTFLYMLHHPDIKAKVQKELDFACGSLEYPTMDMLNDTPFTSAVLHESFRLTSLAPLSNPHSTSADVKLGQHTIPKGTMIFTGLSFVMRNPTYFEDPDHFKPRRFIGQDGKFKPSDQVIPFSLGKRQCLGQTLAMQEFYLFFAGIMRKFNITLAPGETLPSYDMDKNTDNGLIRMPPIFKVVFEAR